MTKPIAATILEKELGWRNYGGHHHESLYTVFFQSYYLPKKFGIDKRILASFCKSTFWVNRPRRCAGANKKVTLSAWWENSGLRDKKLGLSAEDFKNIMSAPIKSFVDYPTYFPLVQFFWFPLFIAYKLNLVPQNSIFINSRVKQMIAIVDFGMGNIRSIYYKLGLLGIPAFVSSSTSWNLTRLTASFLSGRVGHLCLRN